jgi:protein-S-isoprenylcysteine O-methyltransferase Ste14
MFKTIKTDWYFIIPATLFWISALSVTAWDFVQVQQASFRFGFINLLGLTSMLAGIAIRRWAKKDLGKCFSSGLRILNNHQLVTYGIYKRVRHPAYLGNFLFWFGVPLLFSSLYSFLAMLLLIPCYVYRMQVEEKMLIERFRSEYLEYMKHSKRLIPYIY